jgi:hypothetical protein
MPNTGIDGFRTGRQVRGVPAASAASIPAGLSSTTRQRSGAVVRRCAAYRNRSGAGLPRATIVALNRCSPKRLRRPVIFSFLTDLLQAAARRDADGQCQRIERFGNSLDRCKRLTKPDLDHQSDTLGIRGRQRAAPLALDDFEHFRIAHAAEAFDEFLFRDRIAAGGEDVSMGLVDDRLAVDQHSVAVENDQLEPVGNRPDPSP